MPYMHRDPEIWRITAMRMMAASNENVDKYSCPKQDMNDLYLNLINTRKKT
jgi:hypothetical protein